MIILKELTDEGKSIILITHKLDEIKKWRTVVRLFAGAKYWHRQCERRFFATVSRYDGGSFCFLQNREKPAQPKETILSIKDLVVKESRGLDAVKNLSLDVRAGEVVGIAGIDGNGQTELIQALAGLTKVENGSIHLNEKEITNRKPREITEMGVAHVPEDRHKYGLVLEMTLAENIGLQTYYQKPYSSTGILNYRMINKHARELIEEYDVRTLMN